MGRPLGRLGPTSDTEHLDNIVRAAGHDANPLVPDLDLTTLDGLLTAVARFHEKQFRECKTADQKRSARLRPDRDCEVGSFTGTHCTRCGESRRMTLVARDERCRNLNPLNIEQTTTRFKEMEVDRDPVAFTIGSPPPIFTATCAPCRNGVSLIVDCGPPPTVIVLGYGASGLATAHTPPAVAYYLDQAFRARSRGAFTAAVVMYRSALEHLLHDQGFRAHRLIDSIEAAIEQQPEWLAALDEHVMQSVRKLGNRAVHTNGGDLSQQIIFDEALIADIEWLFGEALDEIYELPARRVARRERLSRAPESNS